MNAGSGSVPTSVEATAIITLTALVLVVVLAMDVQSHES
jgi:hypothetical protein